jgi:hypothetical protein
MPPGRLLSAYVVFVGAALALSVFASVALHELGHVLAAMLLGGTFQGMHVTPAGGWARSELPSDAEPWAGRTVTGAGMAIELVVGPLVLLWGRRVESRVLATTASLFGAACVISVPLYCFWSLSGSRRLDGQLGDPMVLVLSFLPPIKDSSALRAALSIPFWHHGYWLPPALLLPAVGALALRPYLEVQSRWFPTASLAQQRFIAGVALGVPATVYAVLVELIAPMRPMEVVLFTVPLGLLTLVLARPPRPGVEGRRGAVATVAPPVAPA